MIAAGERIPVDALVVSGTSDLDRSVVNGESAPISIRAGDAIEGRHAQPHRPACARGDGERAQFLPGRNYRTDGGG